MATLKIIKASSGRGRRKIADLGRRGEALLDAKILTQAGRIVAGVRRRGDKALLAAVRRYDGVPASSIAELRLEPAAQAGELPAAEDRKLPAEDGKLPAGFEEALERAIGAVERYHRPQVHPGFTLEDGGVSLEERRRPLSRVGIYIPGGRAAYPSSVLMTAIPARLAGVEEIVVATPPATWETSAALRYVLARLSLTEVWGMGGAHAVAALAYGTESIARVDKIAGPGNAWVTAAKQIVQGDVGVDSLAGPSEVVIVATGEIDPVLVAADLLAQAEHDPQALPLLVTDSKKLAKEVARCLTRQLPELATAEVARAAIARQGAALVVDSMDEAAELVDAIAPEHLQLVGEDAEALAERIDCAGAIFVGASTPEVFGDYVAGPSHVLPTVGTARFASALGVEDFVRRSHVVRFEREAAEKWATAAAAIADVEGLPAHAAAARLRMR